MFQCLFEWYRVQVSVIHADVKVWVLCFLVVVMPMDTGSVFLSVLPNSVLEKDTTNHKSCHDSFTDLPPEILTSPIVVSFDQDFLSVHPPHRVEGIYTRSERKVSNNIRKIIFRNKGIVPGNDLFVHLLYRGESTKLGYFLIKEMVVG